MIGFDTSLATTSACVLRADGKAFQSPSPGVDRLLGPARHSQELLPELERLLEESGTAWEEVESIAVGVGPGTFTGLRIGVATARALGQALAIDLLPVSSLEALAVAAAAEFSEKRPLLSMIDARRGQVFVALYERTSANGFQLEPLWRPEVVDPDSLVTRIRQLDPSPICFGDWAIKSRSDIEDAGGNVPPSASGLHAVSGLHLCRLAMNVEAVSPADVYPAYLRLPDAEINRRLGLGTNTDDSQDR